MKGTRRLNFLISRHRHIITLEILPDNTLQ